jgi:hypothetical protein
MLLIPGKPIHTHKTQILMIAYLYDVVKPLKSIFFSFIYTKQQVPFQKIRSQVPVNNTLGFRQELQ